MNIGEMQRKISLWAEQDKRRKFHGLFDLICDRGWLLTAHDYVAQNAGSVTGGCDGVNMKEFDEDLGRNLDNLRDALRLGTFQACPVRRVYIPKKNGKLRPLGIPTIRDRVVQEAVRMVLEPIYEADFSQHSIGFRPNRCTMDAISRITLYTREHRKKFFWVIEGDISAYFDTINHRKLMKLLRKRIEDARLLNLIWSFLRSGVMERKLFKDTKLGTPQGGIISPLLANVYLHELDKHMEKYVCLTQKERDRRRKERLGNFAYVRYADDFVVLCNGTRENAETMREELCSFLRTKLRLTLSMEKTRITHVNDGFNFLGFRIHRYMGHQGMVTKVLIPNEVEKKHLDAIKEATSPSTHENSVGLKLKALNRIIGGWSRYYQYTSRAATQFGKLKYRTFRLVAHWLGRKFKLTMPAVMKRFYKDGQLGSEEIKLTRHTEFHTLRWKKSHLKPNPYTTQAVIKREELLDDEPWTGHEDRPGWYDIKRQVIERDNWTCQMCKATVTLDNCEVDHLRPYCCFKRPVDANQPGNLWTLCVDCHRRKTERERQMESRVQ